MSTATRRECDLLSDRSGPEDSDDVHYLYLVSALAVWFMLARAAFAHFGG
jgi:hypothetical protein